MSRFSGTVIPAPSEIRRLQTGDSTVKYIVSWFHDDSFYTNVFVAVHHGRVLVEHIYSCRDDGANIVADELFAQSAILNVQARLK